MWGKWCWWLLSRRAALGVKGSEKRSENYPKDCAKQKYKILNYIIEIYKCTVRAVQCVVNKSDGNMELPVHRFSSFTALLFTFLHTFWQYICKCQPWVDLLVWNLPSAPVWGWTCSRNLHVIKIDRKASQIHQSWGVNGITKALQSEFERSSGWETQMDTNIY